MGTWDEAEVETEQLGEGGGESIMLVSRGERDVGDKLFFFNGVLFIVEVEKAREEVGCEYRWRPCVESGSGRGCDCDSGGGASVCAVAPGTSVNGNKLLLAPTHQTLLHVFSTNPDEDHIYVLAFIPTISSPSSGGSFRLLNTPRDQLYEMGTIECSTNTAHCHLQDFMVIGNWLYTRWDRHGQSIVEKTIINVEDGTFNSAPWHVASYAPEPELTPAYLEEQLLSPGSLTEKFYEAIMRPGMFSALTLRTAIDQYTDSCLSLPGPRPPQLSVMYINLNRDPKTGAFQHANYWNALKRDWEGFIARCREVERSARWPLVLGAQDQGEIIVVERERV
ncbi:hypothetical protein BDZ94DRAFT_1302988, partial [Collybia nuda]